MTAEELLEKFMLALTVFREARGESDFGKQLVAQVIVNRSKDAKKRWPRTIRGVVLQKLQFSCYNPDDPNSQVWPVKPEDTVSWIKSVWAAEKVLDSSTPFIPANHYHTKDVNPAWADPAKIVTREGNHIFYAL